MFNWHWIIEGIKTSITTRNDPVKFEKLNTAKKKK